MNREMHGNATKELEDYRLINLIHDLADISGHTILPYFRSHLEVEDKDKSGNFDPVTKADREAELSIRKMLEANVPHHGIIGEEYDDKPPNDIGNGPFSWVIDPIDGTRGFMSGFPIWGTLIGLLHDSRPVIGAMNQPFIQERFWSDGQSSHYKNPRKSYQIKTRPCAQFSDAVLSTTDLQLFKRQVDIEKFYTLQKQVKLTRYGGDCYAYCLLAAGHLDLVVERGLKIYDIAPLIPIIENAGGVVTCWNGNPAVNGGTVIAAGDHRLHELAIKILSR